MARMLIDNEWYDELSTKALYESRFEDIMRSQAESIFPEYYTVPFKFTVESPEGTAKADLALIDKNYMGWWVVEVEMSRHSLKGHVLPQVEILSKANYDDNVAAFFHRKQPLLDLVKLSAMMKGMQPRVLVVVDLPSPKWVSLLQKYDAILALFQIFKAADGKMVFRINGEYPFAFENDRSICNFEKLISNFLIVHSPAILDVKSDETIEIFFDHAITEWKRIDISDTVYLIPTGFNPLDIKQEYILRKDINGVYYLSIK